MEGQGDTCLSGGAEGADLFFGKLAAAAGHHVIHFGFSGMKSREQEAVRQLTNEELQQANEYIHQASQILQRHSPTKPYVRKLIQRNFFQVNTAENVYAVSRWNLKNPKSGETEEGKLGGGTGWAVAMAILLGVPNIYLYAIEKMQWYRYSYESQGWEKVTELPAPSGRYAGIGSRDLGDVGERAIAELYGTAPPAQLIHRQPEPAKAASAETARRWVKRAKTKDLTADVSRLSEPVAIDLP
eukprot:Skav213486  [mRNA]  locus=scaffold3849:44843:45568:- [translate_table: standard]